MYKPFFMLATLAAAVVASIMSSCSSSTGSSTSVSDADTLSIISYNLRRGWGLDDHRSANRVADVIRPYNPDFVAVQELDSMTARNPDFFLGDIAAALGMTATYGAAIDYDGGKYGVGLLSREKPLVVSHYPLPGREEERTLLVAEFDRCVMACTHLSLTDEDRLASTRIIRDVASRYDKPFFIAGDFNDIPGSQAIDSLETDMVTLNSKTMPTFPADHPDRTIDFIMVGKTSPVEVISSEVVPDSVTSDHRPVVVLVRSL